MASLGVRGGFQLLLNPKPFKKGLGFRETLLEGV